MLYERSVEVIILDINILKYFIKTHQQAIYQKAVIIHPLFDKKDYSVGFKSKKLRQDFELGLECIKHQGSYQTTLTKYHG
ncbi:MAG: hypothetical protein ACSHW0_18195 [Thalassotalea sp.]